MAKLLAKLVIIFSIVLLIFSVLFSISFIALEKNIILKSFGLIHLQRLIYFGGKRNLWMVNNECAEYDQHLIYIPKNGACNFNNTEFKTILNFNKYGRINDLSSDELLKKSGAIALLGDSFAMGWGVNDDETFSVLLEKKVNKKVFNTAVASYGTYRQLIRFERLNLHKYVDTIIIQYNNNDLDENKFFQENNFKKNRETFEFLSQISKKDKKKLFEQIGPSIKFSLARVYSFFFLYKNDFKEHQDYLIKLINKFENVKNKRIIIFYLNHLNKKFKNYPLNQDEFPNIEFIEINLDKKHFFLLDQHINRQGHEKVAEKLTRILNKF